MSKKYALMVSLIGSLVFTVCLFATSFGLCAIINSSCVDTFDPIAENFSIFIPLFLLCLITYKMRDEVYRAWLRFSYVWIPLSMLLIFLAPEYTNDWMVPIVKGTVAFFSSALFVIISLIIIIWKSLASRRK